MSKIEATVTVLEAHKTKVEELLLYTDLLVDSLSQDQTARTSTLKITNLGASSDLRLESVLSHLQEENISFSYTWNGNKCIPGGEKHYRSNGKDEQFLSWMDYEKNLVGIEDVRNAVAQGDTAILELLDVAENQFIPWDWSDVAA